MLDISEVTDQQLQDAISSRQELIAHDDSWKHVLIDQIAEFEEEINKRQERHFKKRMVS